MADKLNMNDFLLQYFMQMHFNNMPPAQRAQFDAYAKNDDFRGHMKDWKKQLMHDNNGQLVQNDIPDASMLAEDELKKLFLEFQRAFREMAANKKNFSNSVDFSVNKSKVIDFLDEYFGVGKLFEPAKANQEAEQQIEALGQFLKDNASQMKAVLRRDWGLVNDTDFTFKDLQDGIKDKKYNTDTKFRKTLTTLAEYLSYPGDTLQGLTPPAVDKIGTGFEDTTIDPNRLDAFKTEFDIILRKIYRTKDIREAFPSDKVKNAYEKAKNNVDYDNKESKDYVPPKRDDELNPWQQVSKFVGDTYEDTFAKYIKFSGDRMYFSPQAKSIVEALHKAKVKPTDGLDGVLKNADTIKKGLLYKSPKATEHFDWTIKTLTELQATMPKAFAGALQNGRQMRAIIQEMIMTAVRDGKVEEAKSAMEVMSVIKYGYTTSKTMDALKKVDVSIFSDKDLSWNKNEGMAFVTKALDKGIKYAITGLGYGITMAVNAYNLSGSKFKGERDKNLKKASDNWANKNATEKQDAEAERRHKDAMANQEIQQKTQDLRDANNGLTQQQRITDSNLGQKKADLDNDEQRLTGIKNQINNDKEQQSYKDAKTNVDTYNNLNAAIPQLRQEGAKLRRDIKKLNDKINQIQIDTQMTDAEKQFRTNALLQQKIEMQNRRTEIAQELRQSRNNLNNITNNPNWANQQQAVTDMERRENDLQQEQDSLDDMKSRVKKYESAKNSIEELSEQISKRDEEIRDWDNNHKDQYKELMAYWDMLETGRNTRTGKMYNWGGRGLSAKGAQGKFDAKKQQYINDYLSNYSYTA
ncbi:MAG: hypothetical protein IJY99_01415 [Alphaproteobacteria bacterium]|nr:hypothetical protein [Alphaproteobacteria bacterium]